MFQNPKIGVIGLGMVGLPLKKYFEEKGFKREKNLFLYDKDETKGFLDDISNADIIFVCVPTPSNKDGSCNTGIVESVVKQFKDSDKILVLKSTIEPGTAFRLKKKYNCRIFFSPEFLTEANSWNDFIKPDRQIVGHTNDAVLAKHILSILPSANFKSPSKDIKINAAEAEIGKYGANVFGAMKVVYGNILADFCAALENNLKKDKIETIVHYDHVKNIMGFDKRIGFSWLNVNHGDYRGFGGYCLAPEERLFIFNSDKHKIIQAREINSNAKSVLGWKNGEVIKDKIIFSGRRKVNALVQFLLKKGRSLTVTPDHIMIVSDEKGNLQEKIAKNITSEDYIPIVLDGFKDSNFNNEIILKIYQDFDFSKQKVFIEKLPQNIINCIKQNLTFHQYKGLKRSKRLQSLPLNTYLKCGFDISLSARVKTGITGSLIPAMVKLDEDFARLIGYYLAEGCVTDNRIIFTFNYLEKDLIEDLKAILKRLDIKFSNRISYWKGKESAFTFKISSRILSSYFSKWGTNSYNKLIPSFIFHSNQLIKDNILAGLFRGDGCIFRSNQGNYWTVNFATTSQILAEGADALLREKGILATIKKINTAKTKVPAWSLDVSEMDNVKKLLSLFTPRQREKVKITKGRPIKSPSYKIIKKLALVGIKAINNLKKNCNVYSIETLNHQYITSWGILTHNCFPKDTDAFIAFAKKLEKKLSVKNKEEKRLKRLVERGIKFLEAMRNYNFELLKTQGLTIKSVSRHDKELEEKLKNIQKNQK